jgi:hypothetical protein
MDAIPSAPAAVLLVPFTSHHHHPTTTTTTRYGCWNASDSIRAHVQAAYGNLSNAAFARLQAEWTANVSAAAVVATGKTPTLWQPTAEGPGDPAWDDALPASTIYMVSREHEPASPPCLPSPSPLPPSPSSRLCLRSVPSHPPSMHCMQVWLNAASAAAYAKAGKRVIYTTPYYVAGMGSNGWLDVYNAQLMPAGLSPDEQANVLGGEVRRGGCGGVCGSSGGGGGVNIHLGKTAPSVARQCCFNC